MPELQQEHLEPRVARLEQSVEGLNASLTTLTSEVRAGFEKVGQQGRIDWTFVATACGVVVTVVIALGSFGAMYTSLSLAPLNSNVATLNRLVEIHEQSRLEEIREREKIRANVQAVTIDAAHRERLLRMLWKKVYGEELPESNPTIHLQD